jgi:uncharacterized protein YutE (UPF0331/DUF86 family)
VVSVAKVEGLIRNVRRFTGYLGEIATVELPDFLADPVKIGAARYYLQVSIEACIDIANHIIASEVYRAPRNYKDAFAVLGENEVIPPDFVPTMQAMAGFRNLLVHLYWEVDDRRLYDFLTTQLGDFDRFVAHVLDFMARAETQ